jgi:hypothetical protein
MDLCVIDLRRDRRAVGDGAAAGERAAAVREPAGCQRRHFRLREDPLHDELRGGSGGEGEGAPRRGEGGPVVDHLACGGGGGGGVLGDGADTEHRGGRGRGRGRARGVEGGGGGAPRAGEELERVERRLRGAQVPGGGVA